MQVKFTKVSPTENMTVFVWDDVLRTEQVRVALKLMAYGSLHAEQVGFVETGSQAPVRLQMMGGEFCVNATRALAAVLVRDGHSCVLNDQETLRVPIEVSGSEQVHVCSVTPLETPQSYDVALDVPLHTGIQPFLVGDVEGMLVELEGITHLVVPAEKIESKMEFFHQAIQMEALATVEAAGIMFYNEVLGYMEPLVYVRGTDTLIWERGCGSGTAAVGVALSYESGKALSMEIHQPGGKLTVSTEWRGESVEGICIGGEVRIVADGEAYVE